MGTTQRNSDSVDPGDYERVVHRQACERNNNGSIGITLPKDQVDKYDIEDGDQLAVLICSDGLVIDP